MIITKKMVLEEIKKSDIKKEVIRVLDSNLLKDKISDLIKKELKSNPELQNQVVDITKNVLIQLYKTLWVKRSFWTSQLSNKSA